MNKQRQRPKVSVCMISYNHDKYVAQAIESVLMQQVEFDYELVIGEDCSTDNTRALVIGYQLSHPDKIHLLLPKVNLGMMKNSVQALNACQGEFIALIEGDDYWTTPAKLQRQVDYLSAHPECSIVFSSVFQIREDKQKLYRPVNQKSVFNLQDLFVDNFIPTCSVMYRNHYGGNLPKWIEEAPFGDWPIFVLHAIYGDIGYIEEPMAAYRLHSGGVWTSKPTLAKLQDLVKMAKLFSKHLPAFVPREQLKRLERASREEIVYRCLVWGSEPHYGRRDAMCLLASGCWPFERIGHFLRFLVWFFCPVLGRLITRKLYKRNH